MCQNHNIPLSLSKDGGATGGLISKTGAFKTVVCYEYALSPHFLIFNSSLFYWHKKNATELCKIANGHQAHRIIISSHNGYCIANKQNYPSLIPGHTSKWHSLRSFTWQYKNALMFVLMRILRPKTGSLTNNAPFTGHFLGTVPQRNL